MFDKLEASGDITPESIPEKPIDEGSLKDYEEILNDIESPGQVIIRDGPVVYATAENTDGGPDVDESMLDDNGKQFRTADGGWVPNNVYVLDGTEYRTDDYGNIYMIDGELVADEIYELNGNVYTTDSEGRITSCNGEVYNETGEQNSQDVSSRTPENHGTWSGERGNSMWYPDPDYTPLEKSKNPEEKPYSNPDNLTWGEILEKYGIEGIEFKDGYPVFDDISKGTVRIEGFETGGDAAKRHNFEKAYVAMAEERGCSPEEVKAWMKENNYTWHECEDKATMQKVPNEVHANIDHVGGRAL